MINFHKSNEFINPCDSVNLQELYKSFMSLYRKWAELKSKLSKSAREDAGIKKWKELNNDIVKIKLQMTSWTSDINKHKSDNSILSFFAKSCAPPSSTSVAGSSSSTSVAVSSSSTLAAGPSSSTLAGTSSSTLAAGSSSSTLIAGPSLSQGTSALSSNNNEVENVIAASASAALAKSKMPPHQEACVKKIEDLKNEYNCINRKNFKTDDDSAKEKLLKKKIKEEESTLKRLKDNAKHSQTYRAKLKAKRTIPPPPHEKEAVVRPGTVEERLLNDGIDISLKDAIVELVTHIAAAEQKRQSDIIRACTSLNVLKEQLLHHFNIDIARTTLYTRILPRNSNTREGRRHYNCAPVRLLKAHNDLMKEHIDGHFAAATVKHIKDLAAIMGPSAVFFLSQDDKARIALGLPAVQNQTRVAMHVQYRIKLPDHDWVVAARHKLIPSVYASCVAGPDGSIGFNGPTYIAVRSGKHDHSGADTHLQDFHRLFELEEFSSEMKDENGQLKPILLVTVDGGPDENPRFPKTLSAWSSIFIQYDLDMLIVATHAPGQSAYNAVERRMAPLSKALSGVILPYDTYGSHLNSSHKTVDEGLELKNFKAAGQSLAEIWSEISISKFPVVAEFISPDSEKPALYGRSEKWINDHVLQTQYCLQISKCNDGKCCDHPKTTVFSILNGRFLPSPVPFSYNLTGPMVDEKNGNFGLLANRILYNSSVPKDIVFDSFCPSVKKDLKSRTCDDCGKYFATKKAKLSHRKSQVCKESDDYLLESESEEEASDEDMEEENVDVSDGLPVTDPSTDPYAYVNVFENLSI